MAGAFNADIARIDGRDKVTGAARYASDVPMANPAHAYLVTSAIARGRIVSIDERETLAVPGVIEVMSHKTMAGQVEPGEFFAGGGYLGSTILPLDSDRVHHDGQIVAVVLADRFEAAREGAYRLRLRYEEEAATAGFDRPGTTEEDVPGDEAPAVGDADAAFVAAAAKIDAEYETPTQHHNPIELFTTTASWSGKKLTIHEPSQFVHAMKNGLAQQLRMAPADIRVISPYVGGAFGSKGSLTQRTALIALAARRLGRPVKLVATRDQGFTIATYRAETRHRLKLGSDREGRLQALVHEGFEITSRPDSYKVAGTSATARIYACPNVRTSVTLVHADRNTPGFMRSPAEVPYMFALESAMDELAHALRLDPIALRRRNDTQTEPIKGLPYTSRSLMQCYDAGAAAFGWVGRSPQPGATRDGDWLVGLGCATAVYPGFQAAAAARVTMTPDGRVRVQIASHDVGTGAYTVVALTAAEALGVAVEAVAVELGDSDLPPGTVAGGSMTTAATCLVVGKACAEVRARKAQGASGAIEAHAEHLPDGLPPEAIGNIYQGRMVAGGGFDGTDRIIAAFGAAFVEVRVHARTREIRVPRVVGAFAAGRIVAPRQARSQLMGGLIWGIGSALHEATEIDRRSARYVNDNIAEYLIPVNADVPDIQVIMLPEEDARANPLGIKGLGELGNVGTNAAVANAVFHATGKRVRRLPIRIEDLL